MISKETLQEMPFFAKNLTSVYDMLFGATPEEEIPTGKKIQKDKMHYKCYCCGRRFYGWGHDPLPLSSETHSPKEGPRVCNECNIHYVLPMRLASEREGWDWRNDGNRMPKPMQLQFKEYAMFLVDNIDELRYFVVD